MAGVRKWFGHGPFGGRHVGFGYQGGVLGPPSEVRSPPGRGNPALSFPPRGNPAGGNPTLPQNPPLLRAPGPPKGGVLGVFVPFPHPLAGGPRLPPPFSLGSGGKPSSPAVGASQRFSGPPDGACGMVENNMKRSASGEFWAKKRPRERWGPFLK